MAVYSESDQRFYYDSYNSYTFIISMTLFAVICIIYNIFWLRKQLQQGFSEERTLGNFSAEAKVYSGGSLLGIFIVSIVAAHFTGGVELLLKIGRAHV